jgi:hypothetical protein
MDWGFGFCHQEGREPGGFEILEEETHTLSTGHQHMQSLADGGTTGKASPPIGHNNPPPDRTFKRRWVTALFAAPKKPYGAISMAFKVYVEMDSQGRGASISNDEFRDSCGISDGSCRVFKKWLVDNEFIRIEVRGQRGRKSTFQATIPGEIPAPPAAIPDEIPADNAASPPPEYRQPSPPIEPEIPATAAASSGIPAPPAANSPASRVPERAQMESLRDSYTPGSEGKTPFYPPSDGERVTFENGRLEIRNGLKQFWLEKFGDEELLDLAVIQAAGYVQPNSHTRSLEVQVSSQLAGALKKQRDQDARYARAVKTGSKAPVNREPAEDRSAKLRAQNEQIRKEFGFDKEA